MYLPRHFTSEDRELAFRLIAEYPLALVVGPDAQGQGFGSHLPLVARVEGDAWMLEGHMARANPHWGWLAQQRSLLAVFSGPSAYVSPSHYDTVQNVPTWNYAALHAYGDIELVPDEAGKDELLKRLIAQMEPDYAEQWRGLDPGYQHKMLAAIVGFRIRVTRWELKLKLSQNRAATERARVQASLAGSARPGDRAVADWMALLAG
ncbi:MAG: FMN-binding negative transcriptional regulator [Roseateles depolymerans]|uniref:FMN-binding negative transcriptional regulator n=1 Tax=Roseateles depolymerans TaxID=76731 RepID=A0A2W5E1P3_9BURK|nr:MAG: FMN-binding negative transcriptional regulator [Roseateles depolymerans]